MKGAWGDRKSSMITAELVRGREFTNQLQVLLGRPLIHYAGEPTEALMLKIVRSFTEALAILKCGDREDETAAFQSPEFYDARLNSPPRSDDREESCRSSAMNCRRGSYKRRKTTETWTKTSPNLVDDGHAWRKYGQKVILNSTYPRSYYRCTHKYDQGCQATKQVQKTEGEMEMYQTTYSGHHTCRSAVRPLHLAPDRLSGDDLRRDGGGDDHDSNSILLCFESGSPVQPFLSSFAKHDDYSSSSSNSREDPGSSAATAPPISSSVDHHFDHYLLSPDLMAFECSDHVPLLSSSDYGEVISRTAAAHGLDMDGMVGSVDFADDILEFDF